MGNIFGGNYALALCFTRAIAEHVINSMSANRMPNVRSFCERLQPLALEQRVYLGRKEGSRRWDRVRSEADLGPDCRVILVHHFPLGAGDAEIALLLAEVIANH